MVPGINEALAGRLTMDKQEPARPSVQNVLLRALRIATSTVAIVELLRNDWARGCLATLAWIVFTQVERLRASSDDGHQDGWR